MLSRICQYKFDNAKIMEGFEWIQKNELSKLSEGRYDIDGDNVYALVSDYKAKPASESSFEMHHRYIDIQYMVSGHEYIGYAPLENQQLDRAYDEEHDYALYEGEGSFMKMGEGMFAVFLPGDLHMPGIGNESQEIRKVVVKVKV